MTSFFKWLTSVFVKIQEQTPREKTSLGSVMLTVARLELGNAEIGGNNKGKYCDKYRFGRTSGAWCAWFLSWCMFEACRILGTEMPFRPQGGAKKFYSLCKRYGQAVEKPSPGDVVLWDRGRAGDWKGHVGICSRVGEDGVFWTIEGNRGGFPAKVDEFKHVIGEGRLLGFARLS